jgi:hypothetical protein
MYKARQEKSSSRKKGFSRVGEKVLEGWDRAISEAQKKITKLQHSIQIFEEARDKGEPFPSEESKQSEAKT